MYAKKLLLSLGILLARCLSHAQGTFQDLDFEEAQIVTFGDSPTLISASAAFPGWTLLANGVPFTINAVQIDSVLFDGVGLLSNGAEILPIDGKFSALLSGFGLSPVPVGIEQSGTIPSSSKSLTFLTIGQLSVSFAGHALTVVDLGAGPGLSELYGANISSYAGEYGQLVFQTYGLSSGGVNVLDDITFSTQSIPEPGMISMLGLCTFIVGLWRSRSAV